MKDEDKTKEQLINKLAELRGIVEPKTSKNRSIHTEENLRETRDYLEKLFHYANAPIVVWDTEFRITRFNKAFEHLTCYTAEDVIGKKIHILFPEASRDESMSKIASSLSGEYWESVEISILRKDGDNRIALWNATNIYAEDGKTIVATIAQGQDITERRQAEEELRQLKEFSEGIVQSMSEGIAVEDAKGRITFVNQAATLLTGYTPEELLGQHWTFLVPPDQQHIIQAADERRMRGESDRYELELVRKDGRRFSVLMSGRPRFEGDCFAGTLAVFVDITEHRQAEKALLQAEIRYSSLFDGIPVGLYRTNPEGKILGINLTGVHMLGYPDRQTFMMISSKDLYANDDDRKRWQVVIEADEVVAGFEAQWRRYDGTIIWVRDTARIVRDDNGRILCYEGSFENITERKEAEEEKKKLEVRLIHAQKMEAIGTLAGGIAHNFNNLLTGILGNTSLMLLDTDHYNPNYKRLNIIEKLVQSGSKLTKQLLGYAREGKYEIMPLSLNRLVRETFDTFGTTRKEICIHQEFAKNLFGIKADQGQIEQILWNLYVNAADAMPVGGDLFVKTMNVTHEDMAGKLYKPRLGNYILLTVRDTGIGMERETMERIFEPFFTTKELSKGTGLGLASVYGIIKAHRGYIDVFSKKGEGTTFKIYLPASEDKEIEENKKAANLLRGTGTILFVDDEDMIIDVGHEMLKALGYKVLLARGGKEAIEIYKRYRDKIDVVILDMIMPDMGGGKSYDRLKEINPKVKVLLSSGYSIAGQATKILQRGCNGFIQKPFNINELSNKLREIAA